MKYRIKRSEQYLQHHGILGQKWGQRNGPPYPLGSGDHSASEQKAGWRKSLSKTSSGQTTEHKGLSDQQKKWIKRGAIAAGVALTVVGGVYLAKTGKLGPLIETGRKAVLQVSGFDSETGLKLSKSTGNIKEMINKVNLGECGKNLGRSYNCANCTIALEGQRRGFDVIANANANGMTIPQMGQFFKGLKSDSFTEFNKLDVQDITAEFCTKNGGFRNALSIRGEQVQSLIQNQLSQNYPEGARGNLFIPLDTYNHWINWEKVGNEIKFFDAQDPSRNLTSEIFGLYKYKPNSTASLTAIRLDDLEFNPQTIRSAIGNSTGSKISGVIDNLINTKPEAWNTDMIKGKNFITNYGMALQEDVRFRL